MLKHLPKADIYLKNKVLKTNFGLEINSCCVALVKTNNDNRKYA